MLWIAFKYLVTAALVVLVSEMAKHSGRLGALLASLPIVTTLTLVWLYIEDQPQSTIANHAWFTFWYVLPTLPMFLLFPWLLGRWGFWLALLACALVTLGCFGLTILLARGFGVDLLP